MNTRVRLAGPLEVVAGDTRLAAGDFPGRQGRLVFAALVVEHGPVDRNELAEILWPNRLPSSWTRDLSAVISKLRSLLAGIAEITTGGGRWYALQLPAGADVDIDLAQGAIAQSERETVHEPGALERAIETLSEPFLAGDECAWVDDRRRDQHELRVRALLHHAEQLIARAAPTAVNVAEQLVELAPEREQAHVVVMRARLAMGDRVGAIRDYERLRRMMSDEFGLLPSPEARELLQVALGPDDDDRGRDCAVALPLPIADARRTPIVGRERELHAIEQRLADQRTRVVLLTGPAGIGKSRLAGEVAARAHDDGAVVLFGACLESRGTPYRPIIDAFAAVRHATDADENARRAAEAVTDALGVIDASAPHASPPRADLFGAVTDAVTRLAPRRTLLLVVDDLHWTDTASAQLLEHLTAVVDEVRVIATCRNEALDDERVAEVLHRLRTTDRAAFVELDGLTTDEVGTALSEHAARDIDDALVRAVHAATAGNPLYVREVGRHLAIAGNPQIEPGTPLLDAIGLPRGLAELIDANLARLGADAREVLETAAVISGAIEVGVLARVSTLSEAKFVAALQITRRAGVLTDTGTGDTALRFEHPLVREVLVRGLGPARRARTHQRVAEAIEHYHHDEVDQYSAELAHHLAMAANVGNARDAIDFAVRAGERASAVCAYDEAVHWYSHALRLAPDRSRDPATTLRLLDALGRAQNHAGDADAARSTLLDAVGVAREANDAERFAETVLHLGGVLVDDGFEGGAVDNRLVTLLHDAIQMLPPAASALRARLLVRSAQELHFTGDRARCLALCGDAERLARATNDTDAVAAVLGARHYALYGAPDVSARLALLTDIETMRTASRPDPRWMRDYLELGDLDAVTAATAHFERRLAVSGIASDRYYPAVLRSTLAALRGEFAFAEAAADEALEVGRTAARGPGAVAGVWAAQVFAVRLFDGRLGELRDIVDATADASPARPIWRAAAAFLHVELGDHARAESHLAHLRAAGLERVPDSMDRPMTLALLAWTVAEIGSLDDARVLRDQLAAYRDVLIVLGGAAPYVCAGPAAYPLALLEARLGAHEAARTLLDDAERFATRIGAAPWCARIRRDRQRIRDTTALSVT